MSFGSFCMGAVAGGGVVFGSLSFHFLRTDDGVQLVPKISATFHETYLDVREFGVSDWARHKSIVAAIVHAKKDSIFKGSAVDTVSESVTGLLKKFPATEGG